MLLRCCCGQGRHESDQEEDQQHSGDLHKSFSACGCVLHLFGQVNIDPRCWDSGQFYVAVSRAESIAGIHFMTPIMKQYIRTLSDEVIKILENSLKVIE